MEHDGWTYIFLTAGRKNWHHDQHEMGWVEVAFERFDYTECGVFRKRTAELTEKDRSYFVEQYGEAYRYSEWIEPGNWKDPRPPRIDELKPPPTDTIEPLPTESVGEYIARLQRRIVGLEPPEGFTLQEWQIGQTLVMGMWPAEGVADETIIAFRDAMKARFPEQTEKFAKYMGWGQHPKSPNA